MFRTPGNPLRLMLMLILFTTVACTKSEKNSSKETLSADSVAQQSKDKNADSTATTKRIVSLNGAITEILVALGLENNLVGVDTSSTYPPSVQNVANIGYYRQLSDEGILGLSPTLIIGEDQAGPENVIQQLKKTGTPLVLIHNQETAEGAIQRIKEVAKAVHLEPEGDRLAKEFQQKLTAAQTSPGIPHDADMPRVVGLYARGAGLSLAAGKNTAFDAVIKLAGARNAMEDFEGYQPLSPEALATSNADIILLPTGGYEALGGKDGVLHLQGIQETPAGKNKRILHYDDQLLLGLGPRLPDMIRSLRADMADSMGVSAVAPPEAAGDSNDTP